MTILSPNTVSHNRELVTFDTVAELRAQRETWRRSDETVALVPTMGNLHAGHMSLVELAKAGADRVIVSVFVNPTQFGPSEDFDSYPRTLAADSEMLAHAGVDAIFAPGVDEVYPFGEDRSIRIELPELADMLCGAQRPGHFSGVAGVVLRLLNMVQPERAVFGEKDYQQLLVLKRLVADCHLPVVVEAAPIVRETDGLAMSSRNQYLSPEERALAPQLYAAISACAEAIRNGDGRIQALEEEASQRLDAAGFRPDYVEIRSADDLSRPLADEFGSRQLRILAAAWLGRARLIDNIAV